MSKMHMLYQRGNIGVVVLEPDDGMPPVPSRLPVVGEEIEVWLIGFDEVDDHWMKMTVYEIEGNTIRCGCSPTGIWWKVPLTGPAATWRWPNKPTVDA